MTTLLDYQMYPFDRSFEILKEIIRERCQTLGVFEPTYDVLRQAPFLKHGGRAMICPPFTSDGTLDTLLPYMEDLLTCWELLDVYNDEVPFKEDQKQKIVSYLTERLVWDDPEMPRFWTLHKFLPWWTDPPYPTMGQLDLYTTRIEHYPEEWALSAEASTVRGWQESEDPEGDVLASFGRHRVQQDEGVGLFRESLRGIEGLGVQDRECEYELSALSTTSMTSH